MKRVSAILFLFLLSACAQPVTNWPAATADEIAAEARAQEDYVRAERLKGLVHGLNTRGPIGPRLQSVASRLAPAAVKMCADLFLPDPGGCAYDIHVKHSTSGGEDVINAYADGQTVYITPTMVRFTRSDEELAAILAHEFAHDMMGHIGKEAQNQLFSRFAGAVLDAMAKNEGYKTHSEGETEGALNADLAFSPAFEAEADYVGLYLMARAGYDYHGIANLWRRMSLESPDSIYVRSTHPTNPERYIAIRKTIAEIDEKKRRHLPLLPQLKPGSVFDMPELLPQNNRVAPPILR